MPTTYGARRQGNTKEFRTRPVRSKTLPESQFQTWEIAIERARRVLLEQAALRVMKVSEDKIIFHPWKRDELVEVLAKGGVIRSNGELANCDKHRTLRQFINELHRKGFLVESMPGLYKLAEYPLT